MSTDSAGHPALTVKPRPIVSTMPPLRLAVYGDGGTGKTSLALTFPKPLVIDTDGGLEGGAVEGITDAFQWEPEKWRDLNALYFWLKAKIDDEGYQTIVIDSIDTLCRFLMDEAINLPTQQRPTKASEESLMMPERPDYGKVAYAVDQFLTKLKTLSKAKGVHIVLTSAVRLPDPEKGRLKRSFDVQPAVESTLTYWANIYGELEVLEVAGAEKGSKVEKRVLWTRVSDPVRKNKTRFAALRPGVKDPTFDKISGLIRSAKTDKVTDNERTTAE